MHSRSPWILLAVAALLFAYIWKYERPGTDPEAASAARRPVFPLLEPSWVTAVTLTTSNLTLRLRRVEGQWRLTDPSYPANALLVDAWLDAVASLQSTDQLTSRDWESQAGGLAAFGLEPPLAEVTIEQGTRRFQFRMGDRTALASKMYLQMAEGSAVEITGAEPLDRLPARDVDWRDPGFLNLSGIRFDRLEMRAAGLVYELQRDPTAQRWRLTYPRPARADHGRVELLLQQLQTTQVLAFAGDTPVPDPEPYGLMNPAAVLRLAQGTNTVLTVEFGGAVGDEVDGVFARRSNLPGIVVVPPETLAVVAVPYTEMLDYRLIDRSLEGLAGMEVTATEAFALARSSNGIWQVIRPLTLPTDPGLTAMFIDQLRGLRVLEVTKEVVTDLDLPTYGLAEPQHSIRLLWNDEAPPLPASDEHTALPAPVSEVRLLPAIELRLDFGTNANGRVYVRRSDENPVYALEADAVLALPRAAFELRDRRLWNFQTNQVVSLTVTRQGTTHKLLRSARGQWAFAPGSQGMVNPFALEEAVHRFGTLRARYWVAQGDEAPVRYGIPQMAHRLEIEVNRGSRNETLALDFGATSPSGGPFAAIQLEGQPTVFECPLDVFYPYDEVVRSMALPR